MGTSVLLNNEPTSRTIIEQLEVSCMLRSLFLRAFDWVSVPKSPPSLPPHNIPLLVHQVEVVRRCLQQKRVLVALGMGVGKTICAIASFVITGTKKILVVCPASLIKNWQSECTKFAVGYECLPFRIGTIKPKLLPEKHQIVLVSYSLLVSVQTWLLEQTWGYLICDEAHYIKHATSARSKHVQQLSKHISRVLLLTGTPAQRNEEYWHLLKILDPVSFQYFHAPLFKKKNTFYFADRYTIPERVHASHGRYVYTFKQNTRVEELQFVLRAFMIKMKTSDILDLPPLLRERIVIGEASETKRKWFALKLSEVETVKDTKGKLYADAALMRLTQETVRLKKKLVCDYLLEVICNRKKVILFTFHHEMAQAIMDALDGCVVKIPYIHIDGKTSMTTRDTNITLFQKQINVAILSTGTCATGLNLQFCNWCIHTELSFHSEQHLQADFRCWRLGQKNTVVIQSLFMEGTTDLLMEQSLRSKANFVDV